MRKLTAKEKTILRLKIRKEIRNKTFTVQSFCIKNNTTEKTVKKLFKDYPKLQKEYEEYKQQTNKKCSDKTSKYKGQEVETDYKENTGVVTTRSLNIKTLEDLLRIAEVDTNIWEVERCLINSWEVTIGGVKTGTGNCETFTNYQVKVWLKRRNPDVLALEKLYEDMKSCSPIVPIIKTILPKSKRRHQRELEISLIDIHLGLRCYSPAADRTWTPEDAEIMVMAMLDKLIELTKSFGPFERIIFPMGHDFLHVDNVYGTTTSFTAQPEADAYQHTFLRGEKLGLAIIERMKDVAPVKVISVPGNHARHSEIALSRIFKAYYHNDKNFEIDASLSPFKFHHYGVNLIGFEHGHSIRQQVRLAALMANETRLNGWKEARYCEWHLGDQHRKASGKPSSFEEQGVSVEFLPGLVPPNEWHRIHSFNWQKRAGMAFIWDKTAGPIARLQTNIDNYTGKIMQ